MRVFLPPDLVERCESVALRRRGLAIHLDRIPANGASESFEWAMQADRLGAFAEGAAWQAMERRPTWHDVVIGFSDLPDLDLPHLKIDVKGVAKTWHTLIAHKVRDDWAYLLVAKLDSWTEFGLQGWAWGGEVKTFPVEERQAGRPAYVLPNNEKAAKLRPVAELLRLVGIASPIVDRPARARYLAAPGDATWRAAWEEAKRLGKV